MPAARSRSDVKQNGRLPRPRDVRRFALCLALASAAMGATSAARTAAPQPPSASSLDRSSPPKVDSVRVHKLYLDGDFDEAIPILENNLKETRQYHHDDSVFIFKHLGVMYAAQYETREKGKYYMHRLLMVEPAANILDMYASDMIYMIFKNIQDEFEQNRRKMSGNNTAHPIGTEKDPKVSEGHGNGKAWIWAGTAAAVAAAGVGAYILLSEEPKSSTRVHEVGQ
jgi:hypothetical protein